MKQHSLAQLQCLPSQRPGLQQLPLGLWLWGLLSFSACTSTTTPIVGQQSNQGACTITADCLPGLRCQSKKCQPIPAPNPSPRGQTCQSDSDCQDWFCNRIQLCTPNALQEEAGPCTLTLDCRAPLICASTGTCQPPGSAGTKGLGEPCRLPAECERPLLCPPWGNNPTCSTMPAPNAVDCSHDNFVGGMFRIYHELPSPERPLDDFYQLPFPNILRETAAGKVQLQDHPVGPLAFNQRLGAIYTQTLQEDSQSSHLQPSVFWRTTDPIDLTSLCLQAQDNYPPIPSTDLQHAWMGQESLAFCPQGGPANLRLMNVDPNHPQYLQTVPIELAYGRTQGQYICNHWMGIRPRHGHLLAPNSWYGLLIETSLRNVLGEPISQPLLVRQLLAEQWQDGFTASTGLQRHQHTAYQPLRRALLDGAIDANQLAGISLFRTGQPADRSRQLLDITANLPRTYFPTDTNAPSQDISQSANRLVLCQDNGPSPCDDGRWRTGDPQCVNDPIACLSRPHTRGCLPDPYRLTDYYEFQGKVAHHFFQQGQIPYRSPADGGAFAQNNHGQLVGTSQVRDVCFALTVPKGQTKPSAGWPVVLYAHGTGGHFRSALSPIQNQSPLAAALAQQGFATLGFDGVLHGWHQGDDPNFWSQDGDVPQLFFNLENPRAARDNVLQGAADGLQWLRRLQASNLRPPSQVDWLEQTIDFDPNQVFLLAHSQGTVTLLPLLSYLADGNLSRWPNQRPLAGTVLAGAGSDIVRSVLSKQQPFPIRPLLTGLLADVNLQPIHPMMNLLGWLLAPADGSVGLADRHLATAPATPLLQLIGMGDGYTPTTNQTLLSQQLRLPAYALPPQPTVPSWLAPTPSPLDAYGAVLIEPEATEQAHFVYATQTNGRQIWLNFLQRRVNQTPPFINVGP